MLDHERKVLRETYLKADEALAALSTQLNAPQEAWLAESVEIYRTYFPQAPEEAGDRMREHLTRPPPGLMGNTIVLEAMTSLMLNLHAANQDLYDMVQMADEALAAMQH